MQTATLYAPPLPLMPPPPDPHTSVGHLLSRAYSLPCAAAAQTFMQLVQPTLRFQLALDVLLPLLDMQVDLTQRILVAYMLYALYAPHPIAINPFRATLFATFVRERAMAAQIAAGGGISDNEQLVWVLWKILKGDGNDIGPFSPTTLARSPLPTKLRAVNLTLDDDVQTAQHNSSQDQAYEPEVELDEQDRENAQITMGLSLLLAARDRVLTLSEERILAPLIPKLIQPPLVTSTDLPPLIAHNPTLAHPLVASLLALSPSSVTVPASNVDGPVSDRNAGNLTAYLDVLQHLLPTLPSFDLLGRLLRDETPVPDVSTGGTTTVADLVRTEVLGWFVHEGINWLDAAEVEEREGRSNDDRFAKGVQNLCRFYNSLIKLGIVDPASDADSAEMAHFTLRNSRFEEANSLYRVLAMGKF